MRVSPKSRRPVDLTWFPPLCGAQEKSSDLPVVAAELVEVLV